MMDLRGSDSAADVRLEWKVCHDFAKPKAKAKLPLTRKRYVPIDQHTSASATIVAAS